MYLNKKIISTFKNNQTNKTSELLNGFASSESHQYNFSDLLLNTSTVHQIDAQLKCLKYLQISDQIHHSSLALYKKLISPQKKDSEECYSVLLKYDNKKIRMRLTTILELNKKRLLFLKHWIKLQSMKRELSVQSYITPYNQIRTITRDNFKISYKALTSIINNCIKNDGSIKIEIGYSTGLSFFQNGLVFKTGTEFFDDSYYIQSDIIQLLKSLDNPTPDIFLMSNTLSCLSHESLTALFDYCKTKSVKIYSIDDLNTAMDVDSRCSNHSVQLAADTFFARHPNNVACIYISPRNEVTILSLEVDDQSFESINKLLKENPQCSCSVFKTSEDLKLGILKYQSKIFYKKEYGLNVFPPFLELSSIETFTKYNISDLFNLGVANIAKNADLTCTLTDIEIFSRDSKSKKTKFFSPSSTILSLTDHLDSLKDSIHKNFHKTLDSYFKSMDFQFKSKEYYFVNDDQVLKSESPPRSEFSSEFSIFTKMEFQ